MNAISAVILVGGPGNSMLRTQVDEPVCVLPVPGHASLIRAWLNLISQLDAVSSTEIITGREQDRERINKETTAWQSEYGGTVNLSCDRAEHRGTAGTVADYLNELPSQNDLLVIEGTTTPPENPHELFDPKFDSDEVAGVLGKTTASEPAGMMLLKHRVMDLVPDIGFFDLKEQLLSRVLERGNTILVRAITDKTIRLSSPENYFKCNQVLGARLSEDRSEGPWIHPNATVHPEATLGVNVLVADGARIDPGAVLEDAIVLHGAHIGTESLVVRSIVRHGTKVPPRTRLIRSEEYVVDARTKKTISKPLDQRQAVES